MLLNKSSLNTVSVGINTAYANALRSQTGFAQYKDLAYIPAYDGKKTVEFGWLANMPQLRRWIGDRHIGNLSKYGMQVSTDSYESTIHLMAEEIENDEYLKAFDMAAGFAEVTERKKNELLFNLLAAGSTTLAYDGAAFFGASHPVTNATGGTSLVSNLQAGAAASPWYLLDLSNPVARPIIMRSSDKFRLRGLTDDTDYQVFMRDEYIWGIDGKLGVGLALWQKALRSNGVLNSANFDAAVLQMSDVILEGGIKAGFTPTHLVCGNTNRAAAKQLLEADQIAVAVGTAAASQTNTNFGAVKLIVSPWLP